MNHLAHLALAGDEQALLVGGFLGDFVKGPMRGERPARIELGIRLHRAIDAETARDEGILGSAQRFGPELRRLAPILLDIVGDHLLATRFTRHHGTALDAFSRAAFATLRAHRTWLTDDARLLGDRLEQWDGLAAYRGTEVVERGFVRIATRLRKPELAALAIARLPELLPGLAEDFEGYYPRLQVFVTQWLERETRAAAPGLGGPGSAAP